MNLQTLSTTQSTAGTSKFEVATNAVTGIAVQYFGLALASPSGQIASAGGTAGTIPAGTEKFGINLASGNNTANTSIKTPAGAAYAADAAPSGTNPIGVVSTTPTNYNTAGQVAYVASSSASATTPSTRTSQTVAYATGPIYQTVYTVNYIAAISSLTKPGIYATTIQYVATGAY